VKKIIILCFLTIICSNLYAARFDINGVYEASQMKVKEVLCGWEPDISKGYLLDEDDCYFTQYMLDIPMYGFTFTPKTTDIPDGAKLSYYFSFFDSATPDKKMFKTELISADGKSRVIEGLFHERTLQGLAVVKAGDKFVVSSDVEKSYLPIYVVASVVSLFGVFLIARRKK